MIQLATQDKPFLSPDLTQKLEQIRTLGFDGFEADGSLLMDHFKELKQAVRTTGVPVTSVCGGYRGWIGDFVDYRRRMCADDLKILLARAAELNARGVIVPAAWGMFSLRLPPMTPPRPSEADREAILETLNSLEETCREHGTRILLEPLNRYEDHMLNTLDAAGELIEAGHLKHVLIMADFFHMNIEEKNIGESLRKWSDLIGHIHLADSHRYQPGDGHLDFVEGFKALKEIHFSGTLAFECRVLGEDPLAAYAESVRFIRSCLDQAGLR